MGHSDPAESSTHSPQHDSAPWGRVLQYSLQPLLTSLSSQNLKLAIAHKEISESYPP